MSQDSIMTIFIENLQISGFRVLSELKIDSLGKVNLITGKNNCGKSTLLEAIRILATGGAIRTIFDILDYREELGSDNESERGYQPNDLAPFCNLFTGFPDLMPNRQGFSITATGGLPASIAALKAQMGWFVKEADTGARIIRYAPASGDLFDDIEAFPALDLDIAGRKRVVPLHRLQRRTLMRSEVEVNAAPCIYLDPFSSRSTHQMAALWDAIALTDVEQEVIKALKLVSEDLQAVQMVGGDKGWSRERTAIAKSTRYPSPVPLKTFGDGVNRLFGIILSLCNARNGVLLIDEVENGLHYSVQIDVWHTLFRLARDLNVQVFATSHSWDCVRAFQEAAGASPDDGALIRLSRHDDKIVATPFSEQELAIVTRDQIEVR